ncbi:hypothetical protein B1J92_M11473g [Nakaseomyces glabratus]|nr:hypothetical protein B1J91_M11473g [Nakaseomyces glabratus]OXB46000.1 hypothetical protein B1J92_M11473g [Nakaseomyces glabratus]
MDDYKALMEAQEQWEQSVEQLNEVLNWVLLPLLGKYMGRKLAWRLHPIGFQLSA